MRIIAGLALSMLLVQAPIAAEEKERSKETKSTTRETKDSQEKWENRKSEKVREDNNVAKFGKDTGELASKGAVQASRATTRGVKWLTKPWSKDKAQGDKSVKSSNGKKEKN